MAIRMKEYISKLVKLFIDRNMEYAGEEEWSANFIRNAKHFKNFRLKEIIEEPYGQSIRYVIDKVDRLVNNILHAREGKKAEHMVDCIDDAIVYLFITKQILTEEGLIKEVLSNVVMVCSKCKASITPDNIMYQDNPVLCKKCFKEKDGL